MDAHWSPDVLRPRAAAAPSARTRSLYLPMRDGVRLAVDLHLPDGASRPMPAILRQTRYFRALAVRRPFGGLPIAAAFDLYARTRRRFLAAGYAWLDVDVRGSGASSGSRPYPWSADEVRDGAEVVDWVVRQPWSSGRVGALGISYDGTAAEMLLANQHPAVRAVAPTFALFDVFADVAFPGGIHLAWFTERWAAYNAALDRNAYGRAMAWSLWLIARAAHASPAPRGADRLLARLGALPGDRFRALAEALIDRLAAGVRPVEGPEGLVALAAAITAHARNFSVHEGAKLIRFRDDRGVSPADPEGTIDTFSPHAHAARTAGAGAAVYSYSGWRDGAYPNGAVKRHAALASPGGRLTIGPWVHSGKLRIQPFDVAVPPAFDHDAELLDFFDEHLADRPSRGDGRPIHYYVLGAERWVAADRWPPPSRPLELWLGADRRLATAGPTLAGVDEFPIDPAVGSGERSRWRSLLSLVPGDYPDRAERDRRLLCYDGAPLAEDREVTGHPRLVLHVDFAGADDGQLFAYLEDVAPDGRVAYVTEGQLRALHRRGSRRADAALLSAGEVAELVVDLLPISWLFRRGHRVRLALAGGDADHFAPPAPGTLRIHRGPVRPSRIELPIV